VKPQTHFISVAGLSRKGNTNTMLFLLISSALFAPSGILLSVLRGLIAVENLNVATVLRFGEIHEI